MTETANKHQTPTPDHAPVPDREVFAAPAAEPAAPHQHRLPHSRTGGLWVMLVAFALVLLLLLIFILQNGQRSDVYLLGAHGHLPMGVALLLAAVFGVLLVALPTAVRIVQLRLMAARHRGRISAAARARPEAPKPTGS